MTVESDVESLRQQLVSDGFHAEHRQRWIAFADGRVRYAAEDPIKLARWLADFDPEGQCIVAYADDRPFV